MDEVNLYKLPKDILVKLISTIQDDIKIYQITYYSEIPCPPTEKYGYKNVIFLFDKNKYDKIIDFFEEVKVYLDDDKLLEELEYDLFKKRAKKLGLGNTLEILFMEGFVFSYEESILEFEKIFSTTLHTI